MNHTNEPAWVERLSKCAGNHFESMLAIADGLRIELPDLISKLDRAIADRNAPEVQRLGHTLKSSLRYISDGDDVDCAAGLEMAGKENRLDDAGERLDKLKPNVDQWLAKIADWLESNQ